MPSLSWIHRVKKLAAGWTGWSPGGPGAHVTVGGRSNTRAHNLAPTRLEPRRVLSASIQSLVVPQFAVEGETVEVSADVSGGAESGGVSLEFDWTITRDETVIAQGDTRDFSFVAPDEGDYGVSLTVTDTSKVEDFDTKSAEVRVKNLPPTIENLSATNTGEGQSTVLTGTISDPGVEDSFTLRIIWGDPLSPNNVQTFDLDNPSDGISFDPETRVFSIEHRYLDDNPTGQPGAAYQIAAAVVDNGGARGSEVTTVTVKNVAPKISGLAAAPISENQTTTLSGRISDPGELDTFTLKINWGDPRSPNNIETFDLANPPAGSTFDRETGEFTVQHRYLDDPLGDESAYIVSLSVEDDDGGTRDAITKVEVANEPPLLGPLAAIDIRENETTTLTGTISDPSSLDTLELEIDWGDPDSPGNSQVVDLANPGAGVTFDPETGAFAIEHRYLDDNPTGISGAEYTISVTARDDDGGKDYQSTKVAVANVAPRLDDVSAVDINENGVTTLSGKIIEPGTRDALTLHVYWGDGDMDEVMLAAGATEFSVQHRYLDDQPGDTPDTYTIRMTLVDDDLDQAMDAVTVGVKNLPPVITPVEDIKIDEGQKLVLDVPIFPMEPVSPLDVDEPTYDAGPMAEVGATRAVTFTDAGTLDTHAATVDWGDGTPRQDLAISSTEGGFSLAGHHTYADNGVFTVNIEVVDDDGGQATRTFEVIVNNVAPTVSLVDLDTPFVMFEGDTFTIDEIATFSDPGFNNIPGQRRRRTFDPFEGDL